MTSLSWASQQPASLGCHLLKEGPGLYPWVSSAPTCMQEVLIVRIFSASFLQLTPIAGEVMRSNGKGTILLSRKHQGRPFGKNRSESE